MTKRRTTDIRPSASHTALKAVRLDGIYIKVAKNVDSKGQELLEDYLGATPCEDFGMIPARQTRETVKPRRRKLAKTVPAIPSLMIPSIKIEK